MVDNWQIMLTDNFYSHCVKESYELMHFSHILPQILKVYNCVGVQKLGRGITQ